ncbi:hypothetical protein FRB93_004639 [Tulasnella sp. JGI-2019a]|nr:hypothetical protein FRB93_004639 [Tulasnella sp. JGI-2019a]
MRASEAAVLPYFDRQDVGRDHVWKSPLPEPWVRLHGHIKTQQQPERPGTHSCICTHYLIQITMSDWTGSTEGLPLREQQNQAPSLRHCGNNDDRQRTFLDAHEDQGAPQNLRLEREIPSSSQPTAPPPLEWSPSSRAHKPPVPPKLKPEFRCPGCPRTFQRISGLKQHILSHTGEKPHRCDACHRRFSIASNQRRHMRTCKAIKMRLAKSRAPEAWSASAVGSPVSPSRGGLSSIAEGVQSKWPTSPGTDSRDDEEDGVGEEEEEEEDDEVDEEDTSYGYAAGQQHLSFKGSPSSSKPSGWEPPQHQAVVATHHIRDSIPCTERSYSHHSDPGAPLTTENEQDIPNLEHQPYSPQSDTAAPSYIPPPFSSNPHTAGPSSLLKNSHRPHPDLISLARARSSSMPEPRSYPEAVITGAMSNHQHSHPQAEYSSGTLSYGPDSHRHGDVAYGYSASRFDSSGPPRFHILGDAYNQRFPNTGYSQAGLTLTSPPEQCYCDDHQKGDDCLPRRPH